MTTAAVPRAPSRPSRSWSRARRCRQYDRRRARRCHRDGPADAGGSLLRRLGVVIDPARRHAEAGRFPRPLVPPLPGRGAAHRRLGVAGTRAGRRRRLRRGDGHDQQPARTTRRRRGWSARGGPSPRWPTATSTPRLRPGGSRPTPTSWRSTATGRSWSGVSGELTEEQFTALLAKIAAAVELLDPRVTVRFRHDPPGGAGGLTRERGRRLRGQGAERARARPAACQPHMPCTAPPGGVLAEHSSTPGSGVS